MAPPEHPFPVSELENKILTHSVDLKVKSRKLPRDFDLKECELFELVQYSCTTQEQAMEKKSHRMECYPFVRLFRRCKHNGKMFHVETTAWEGQHAWKEVEKTQDTEEEPTVQTKDVFARHRGYYWSNA